MIGQQLVRSWAPVVRSAVQSRGVSVISGPPRNHVSSAEKVISGVVMAGGMLFIPAWVLYHIKAYKGSE